MAYTDNLTFKIPQWNYGIFAKELSAFRKGLAGIASEPGWFYFKLFFHFDESYGLLGNILQDNPGNTAVEYLEQRKDLFKFDNLNSRLLALVRFVKYLSFINVNAPWFFDKIDGLDKATLQLTEFTKDKQITISCLEDAVDMRLTSLFHLYQFACFDEINMKEIIPENLRKFNMSVVIYHVPIKYYSTEISSYKAKSLNGDNNYFGNRMSFKMYTFKGCEFDLESIGAMTPSSMDNAQPFNLAKSSFNIKYDRVYTHLMNEWDQFMIGPDGIYYDKANGINVTDEKFSERIAHLISIGDNESMKLVDSLLCKPVTLYSNYGISLGNIHNINEQTDLRQ